MVVGQNSRAIEIVKGAGVVVEHLSEYCFFLPRRRSRGALHRKLTPPPGRSLAARVRYRHGQRLTSKQNMPCGSCAPAMSGAARATSEGGHEPPAAPLVRATRQARLAFLDSFPGSSLRRWNRRGVYQRRASFRALGAVGRVSQASRARTLALGLAGMGPVKRAGARPGALSEVHRAARRTDLGAQSAGQGIDVFLHLARELVGELSRWLLAGEEP
jgi:hypothetical protein